MLTVKRILVFIMLLLITSCSFPFIDEEEDVKINDVKNEIENNEINGKKDNSLGGEALQNINNDNSVYNGEITKPDLSPENIK